MLALGITTSILITACSNENKQSNNPTIQDAKSPQTAAQTNKSDVATPQAKASPSQDKNQLKILNVQKQYGGDSFNTGIVNWESNSERPDNFYVRENDGTIYVLWGQYDSDGKYFVFMSSAKDGKWILKGKKIKELSRNIAGFLPKIVYSGQGFFIKEYKSYYQFDEQGNITEKEIKEDSNQTTTVINSSTGAAIFDWKSVIKPLINYPENKILLNDKSGVLSQISKKADYMTTFLDQDHKKLYFTNTFYKNDADKIKIKQFDLTTGDMLYDNNGQDKVAPMSANAIISAGDKGIYALDTDENTISLIDEKLNLVTSLGDVPIDVIRTNENTYIPTFRVFLTDNKDELHVWSIVDFQHKLALQLVTIAKVK